MAKSLEFAVKKCSFDFVTVMLEIAPGAPVSAPAGCFSDDECRYNMFLEVVRS
jgi:hypothetical protein